jgi:hypothetical protein
MSKSSIAESVQLSTPYKFMNDLKQFKIEGNFYWHKSFVKS